MARILIAYHTRTQHTEILAQAIAEGANLVHGARVSVHRLDEVDVAGLVDYDAIVLGSPTYYGTMAAEMKRFLDESVSLHGRLVGKVGGAFASSGVLGGGNETTVLDILRAMLIHGMVIRGLHDGCHYGPVAIAWPDEPARQQARHHGRGLAELAIKLHG